VLFGTQRTKIFHIAAGQVDLITSADHYARIHASGQAHLVGERISALEKQLDPRVFVRIHRTTIVNVRFIREVRRDTDGNLYVALRGGGRHRISRGRRDALRRVVPSLE
jgi:two-component system LytT family response regulator